MEKKEKLYGQQSAEQKKTQGEAKVGKEHKEHAAKQYGQISEQRSKAELKEKKAGYESEEEGYGLEEKGGKYSKK
jgi:hypothetical protein